jgi:hypothetical protein
MSRVAMTIGLALALPVCAAASTGDHDSSIPAYQSVDLHPAQADALRRKVLAQCGLDRSRDVLPWYFHFEYGRALLEAGDARRAVVQLSQSIDLRPEPRARKRTYGMWFTDYLPYFQLAEAHARLDNWPCAEHAMQLSRSTGEAALGRIEPQRIRALQERIDRHTGDVGACQLQDVLAEDVDGDWSDS